MFKYAETHRILHKQTKALLSLSCIFSILPAFAENPRITELIAEKQAKMEKLEKCQGDIKKLKIAGLSTLGLTAVGVAVNVAEAVVLNDIDNENKMIEECNKYKGKLSDNNKLCTLSINVKNGLIDERFSTALSDAKAKGDKVYEEENTLVHTHSSAGFMVKWIYLCESNKKMTVKGCVENN